MHAIQLRGAPHSAQLHLTTPQSHLQLRPGRRGQQRRLRHGRALSRLIIDSFLPVVETLLSQVLLLPQNDVLDVKSSVLPGKVSSFVRDAVQLFAEDFGVLLVLGLEVGHGQNASDFGLCQCLHWLLGSGELRRG